MASTDPADNFDALRLIGALAVLVGHAYILTGNGAAPVAFGIPIHSLGVSVFFVISGYLICGSWERRESPRLFLRNRVLRIFPALIVVVLVTVFVIGPLASTLRASAYISSPETAGYLSGLTLLARYQLPGVFTSALHARSAVNGSLWTLGLEFACYVGVVIVGQLPGRSRTGLYAVAALASIVVALVSMDHAIQSAAAVTAFFALGAFARLGLARRMFRCPAAIGIVVFWLTAALLWPNLSTPLAWVCLPYCVLTAGLASTAGIRSIARYGDFSYGGYLWAFPVQQIVIDWFGRLPLAVDIAIVIVITSGIAAVSWHLIERPALRLTVTTRTVRSPAQRLAAVGQNWGQ